jgi:hypothetical protein
LYALARKQQTDVANVAIVYRSFLHLSTFHAPQNAASAATSLLPPFSAQRPTTTAFESYCSHTPAAVAAQASVALSRMQLAVAAAVWSAVYTDLRTAVSGSSDTSNVLLISHPMHSGLAETIKSDATLRRMYTTLRIRVPASGSSSTGSSSTGSTRALMMQALRVNNARSEHAHSALRLLQQHSNSNASNSTSSASSSSGTTTGVQQGDSVLVQRVLEHGHIASHIHEVCNCNALPQVAKSAQSKLHAFKSYKVALRFNLTGFTGSSLHRSHVPLVLASSSTLVWRANLTCALFACR